MKLNPFVVKLKRKTFGMYFVRIGLYHYGNNSRTIFRFTFSSLISVNNLGTILYMYTDLTAIFKFLHFCFIKIVCNKDRHFGFEETQRCKDGNIFNRRGVLNPK